MKRMVAVLLVAVLTLGALVPAAQAAVNVERQGAENPVLEVAKSTVYGALAGLVLGGALALLSDDNDNDGDIMRVSFVAGTFLGLGFGIYHVATRPAPTAMLEFRDGSPTLHAALPAPGPDGAIRMHLVGVRF